MANAKAADQMYGTACLTVLSIGSKLTLGKIHKVTQQQQEVVKKYVLCIFCKKPFSDFKLCSDHMLRIHHQRVHKRYHICLSQKHLSK